ncbi:VOC family protein [Patulibacter minatonensis]|uniref:VOC family protein n=1 Tax=Patulibacter minatonensis TaxID=298163 RepID=UPI0012FB8396|nr:VOC family protein [Patulibacter minatonensis]
MTDAPASAPARPLPGLPPGRPALGPVHLAVTDRERALAWWTRVLGLELLDHDAYELRLGAGGRELVVLHPGAGGIVARRRTGLYHLAIHVRTDEDFARVLARIFTARWPNSPTDHTFTKTTYLDDPDGNGIEIALETPERVGRLVYTDDDYGVVDAQGVRRSGRDPLDLEEVFAHLPEERRLDEPMPAGTTIGHVHLHVNDLDASMAFYAEGLGLDRHMFARGIGMADVTVDGWTPHLIAFNVWNGPDAPRPPADTAGLRFVTFAFASAAERATGVARLERQGHAVRRDAATGEVRVLDPSGNELLLVVRDEVAS